MNLLKEDVSVSAQEITKKSFESQRKKINKLLKRQYGDLLLRFKDIKFPNDYDDDLVHYGVPSTKKGMTKYFHGIRRRIFSHKTVR